MALGPAGPGAARRGERRGGRRRAHRRAAARAGRSLPAGPTAGDRTPTWPPWNSKRHGIHPARQERARVSRICFGTGSSAATGDRWSATTRSPPSAPPSTRASRSRHRAGLRLRRLRGPAGGGARRRHPPRRRDRRPPRAACAPWTAASSATRAPSSCARASSRASGHLGVEAIDLYQGQARSRHPVSRRPEGRAPGAELKDEGKIRHVGVSNFSPAEMDALSRTIEVETDQPPTTCFNRGIEEDVLPHAASRTSACSSTARSRTGC